MCGILIEVPWLTLSVEEGEALFLRSVATGESPHQPRWMMILSTHTHTGSSNGPEWDKINKQTNK